jgi:hypothetical protein
MKKKKSKQQKKQSFSQITYLKIDKKNNNHKTDFVYGEEAEAK